MKKILLGISMIMLLAGFQANAAVMPFLNNNFTTDDGVEVINPFVITSFNGSVANNSSNGDVWNASAGGYSWGGTGNEYSGLYLGTFSGNDDADGLKALAGYYLGEAVGSSWYKTPGTLVENGSLVITYTVFKDATEPIAGTWSTETADPPVYVSFYSVKAGSNFAFYLVDPADDSGTWATRHLIAGNGQTPAISHLSVLTDPGTPVPEPATMLLFGSGLVGLAGIARRKKN